MRSGITQKSLLTFFIGDIISLQTSHDGKTKTKQNKKKGEKVD